LTGVARLAGGNAFVGDQTITGKVGIGTTTPANQFTVRTPAGGYGIEHTDGVTRMATYIAGGNLGGHLGTISPHSLGFFVNDGPTIMTVHTNGHVGIGTSIPSEKLEVTGNARINGRLNVNSAAADFQSVALVVRMLPGTQAAGSFLDASGNQLVSIYDPVASGLGVALHVLSGNAAKPGGGSWTTLSDVRAKQNIHNLDGALPRLLALRSVTFEFKDPTALGAKAGTQIGFVAQEVEPVFPDWVSTNAKGQKMLSISGFESLTVAALRELQAEQEVQNAKLQEQNRSLEQRVTALEKLINRLSTAQAGAQ
jgi:hypothetical protein